MHSSIVLTLTSIIELQVRLVRGKPPVSWHSSQKDLCQWWIVRFAKHSSPYTSRSKAHVSPISFPNWTQKSIAARCLERISFFFFFFFVSQTYRHTHEFTKTTVVVTLTLHGVVLSHSKDVLFPYMSIWFRTLYLISLLYYGVCIHLNVLFCKSILTDRGLSICSYKTAGSALFRRTLNYRTQLCMGVVR